jgi:hypothetical protein
VTAPTISLVESDTPPRIAIDDDSLSIPEPYVCIALQSYSGCHAVVAYTDFMWRPRRLNTTSTSPQ